MRICNLANPTSVHTHRWLTYFTKKGHDVHLIYFDNIHQPIHLPKLNGVHFHKIPFFTHEIKKLSYPYEILQLSRMINKIKPDILHGHYISHYYCWYAALIDFHPYEVFIWGSDVIIDPLKSKSIKKHVKYVLTHADMIHVHSKNLENAIIQLGAPPEKIKLKYWGIDLDKFHAKRNKTKIRQQLGIEGDQIVICTRDFKPLYDVETVIKAIPKVIKECPKAKFVIKGKGFLENDLKQLAKDLGVRDSVQFVGFGPSDEVPLYLNAADIYVSTSLSEGGSISLWEAMASGIPVVVTDLPANTEWINNGVNGYIVPLKDPKSLAERIIDLLQDENKQNKFKRNNLKIVEKKLNQDKLMAQVEEMSLSLIESYNK